MKYKATKIVALFTAAIMLSACGEKNPQEPAASTENTQSTGDEAAKNVENAVDTEDAVKESQGGTYIDYSGMDPTEMVEANRAADWKITDEPVTLRVMLANTPEHPDDMNEQEVFKRAEEQTGIHIEWVMPGGSAFNEQKSLALASGDMPDIILNGLTDSEIARYGSDGTLLSYTKLFEEYPGMAPNLEHIFAEREDIKKFITSPDGNIYSTPRINEGAWMKQNGNAIINTEWLDNLGFEMPTSVDELKEVLRAFKEQDANGNGDPNDEIPYTIATSEKLQGSSGGINLLMGSFGVIADNDFRMLQDGKLVCSAATEGWKEGISFFHDLYVEGLMDPEAFTMDWNQYLAKLAADPSIVGVAGVWDINDQVITPNATEKFGYLKPLLGPDGQDPVVYKYAAPGWDRSGCVISAKTEYPEEALRWVDYLYDKINSMEMIEGDFGGRLELQDEGYYIIGEPPAGMDSQYVYRYSVSPGHSGAWCVQEKEFTDVLRNTVTEPRSNFNMEFCAPYYVEPFPPVFYTPEEADEMSTLNTAIISEIARQSCEWIMNGGIEEGWEDYLANLDNIGLQRWVEINEQAAERYYAQ